MEVATETEIGSQPVSAEVTEVLAKLMVEMVSPDVIYNAIVPWPEEEFMKITVERFVVLANYHQLSPYRAVPPSPSLLRKDC